jgi:type II secretory pathway component PulJ
VALALLAMMNLYLYGLLNSISRAMRATLPAMQK